MVSPTTVSWGAFGGAAEQHLKFECNFVVARKLHLNLVKPPEGNWSQSTPPSGVHHQNTHNSVVRQQEA